MGTATEMQQLTMDGRLPSPSLAQALWNRSRLAVAVGLFFVLATSVNGLAWVAVRWGWTAADTTLWQERVRKLCRVWLWLAKQFGILRVQVERREVLQGLQGVIVAANHPCLLDAFVLLGLLPQAVCVMRAGLRHHPSLRTLAELAGYLPNDRGPALLRAGRAKLASGSNLLVFPEGTRSEGSLPGPFKPGFARTAVMAQAPVLPVGIHYRGTAFRKGRGYFSTSELPGEMVIRPGSLLFALPGEEVREFARRVREECQRLSA